MICQTLFQTGNHRWLLLVQEPDQSTDQMATNRIAVQVGDMVTIVDPGGFEVFPETLAALTAEVSIDKVYDVVFTHPGPEAISALPLWRQVCNDGTRFHVPEIMLSAFKHLDSSLPLTTISDNGAEISISAAPLKIIPAPFMHSPAAMNVYDAKARILYTGAVGSVSTYIPNPDYLYVEDFEDHVDALAAFHGRFMPSSSARDAWVSMVRELDIEMLVPASGRVFKDQAVDQFLDWLSGAEMATMVPVDMPSIAPPTSGQTVEPKPEAAPTINADPFAEINAADEEDKIPHGEPEPGAEYRLVTRSDFDGLACAVLLEELDMINDILFVHPNDMQEGRIDITANDISTNLPYVPGCYLAFDHHLSEVARLGRKYDNHIIIPSAPSAARVVYEYYGRKSFPDRFEDMMAAVDQGDSAQYSMDDVLNPKNWALLNFIMDSRTGLGRFKGFRIPNYELMMELIEYCSVHSIEEILQLPDVKERVDLYMDHAPKFSEQIKRCATVYDNMVVLDLRDEEDVFVGNRFMVYALFPQCNISMHVMWGRDKQNVVFAVGKSIFDRSSQTNVGECMLQYGGGGHNAAGTCQADTVLAETVRSALIQKITSDG